MYCFDLLSYPLVSTIIGDVSESQPLYLYLNRNRTLPPQVANSVSTTVLSSREIYHVRT